MLASDELVAVSPEPPYRSDSNWLVVEPEASASACSIAELPLVAPDVLEALALLEVPVEAGEADEADEPESVEAAALAEAL